MIVWGGGSSVNTGARYNPLTDIWTPTSTSGAPTQRSGHVAVWTGSRMIVWGGFSGLSLINTGGIYDPSSDSWAPTSTMGTPTPQSKDTAVWSGVEMIVWGGVSGSGGRYNPSTDTWTPVSNLDAPSSGPAVWTGSLMLVLSPDATTAGRRYAPQSDTWTPMSNLGAPPELSRTGQSVVWTGSEMILWGGHPSAGGADLNTGGRYNPSTDSWTLTATLNAPRARSGHAAVWTGSRMIVWGGYNNEIFLDLSSGGRYDPMADSWTPTSETSAPSARVGHKTVWTGNSMIVWGGVDGDGYLGTGGRYDPMVDDWTPTTTLGAPFPRSGHSAVWIGDSMVLWGGRNSTSVFSDGARYDPVSDAWTSTSPASAPAARYNHSAVWNGTRMILWGGRNFSTPLNTGALYDPAGDAWSATSLVGAPAARSSHAAVWTGNQMIIWGGPSTTTGGRYTPATDTWTATAPLNQSPTAWPQTAVWTGSLMLVWGTNSYGARYDPALDVWSNYGSTPFQASTEGHTAVWTGSRMIIWGGGVLDDFGFPLYNTGAIYDPGLDSWTLTTVANAPSERGRHTAVWTGASMIVWGGLGPGGDSPILNTGGVFRFGLSTDDDKDSYSECGGDCEDASAAIHPGAAEICNGLDDDCSLVVDDGGSAMCDDLDACTSDACAGAAGCAHPIRDVDADGHPDAVCGGNDCNDLNQSEWSPPMEVTGLALTTPSPADPSWTSQAAAAGPGTSYDLVSGSVGPAAGITFSSASCLQSSTSTTYPDPRPGPGAGSAFWYLTRARNSCATATYGSAARDSAIPSCP
jgi:N-acetylneuraminic acid mutarotase